MTASVLVLNKSWMPIDVTSVYEAVCKVCRARPRARFVDPDTYATYDFDSWVDTWEDAIRASEIAADKVMESPCLAFRLPEVILLTEYNGFGPDSSPGPRRLVFSRRNIYLRDRNTCQYCGKRFHTNDLNLDHVVPKSKGGQMTWQNIVLSCIACNDKKRNRTPKEAGMSLVRKPMVPKPSEVKRPWGERLKRKIGSNVPETWETFLGKLYWELELKD